MAFAISSPMSTPPREVRNVASTSLLNVTYFRSGANKFFTGYSVGWDIKREEAMEAINYIFTAYTSNTSIINFGSDAINNDDLINRPRHAYPLNPHPPFY
jgi:hypothetical protein